MLQRNILMPIMTFIPDPILAIWKNYMVYYRAYMYIINNRFSLVGKTEEKENISTLKNE
jgi:hypothetical protein